MKAQVNFDALGGGNDPFLLSNGSMIKIEKGTAYPITHSTTYPYTVICCFKKLNTMTLGGNAAYGTVKGYKSDGTSTSIGLTQGTPYDISPFEYVEWFYNAVATTRTLTFA